MNIVLIRLISSSCFLLMICVAFTATTRVNSQEAREGKSVISGDWPMWGGSPSRNQFNSSTGVYI